MGDFFKVLNEAKFTLHKGNHFNVTNSVAFNIFTVFAFSPLLPTSKTFYQPERKPCIL